MGAAESTGSAANGAGASSWAGAGAGASGRSLSSRVSTTPVARRTTTSGPCGRRRSGRRGLPAGGGAASGDGDAVSATGAVGAAGGRGFARGVPSPRPRPFRGRSSRSPPRPAGMPSITSPNVGRGLRGPDPPNRSSLTSPETSCCRATRHTPTSEHRLGVARARAMTQHAPRGKRCGSRRGRFSHLVKGPTGPFGGGARSSRVGRARKKVSALGR